MCLHWRAQHTLCICLQGISLCHSTSENTISASQDSCKRQGWVGLEINAAQLPAPEHAPYKRGLSVHGGGRKASSEAGDRSPLCSLLPQNLSPHPVLCTALRAFTCPISQHPQFGLDSAAALNHRHRRALRGILTLRKHTTSHPERGERYRSELGERQLSHKGVNVLLQVAQHARISQARQCRRESGSWLQLPERIGCHAQPSPSSSLSPHHAPILLPSLGHPLLPQASKT